MRYAFRAGNGIWVDFVRSNIQFVTCDFNCSNRRPSQKIKLLGGGELSKKPTTSTSKSIEKSIHNGMLVLIRVCTRPPNELKLGIVEKIVLCGKALIRIDKPRACF